MFWSLMLLSGRISMWNCNSCLHLCLIQPVWYWQHYEYSFFGRTYASGFVADSDFPCLYVVALAQTSSCLTANVSQLPDGKYVATIFQTILLSGREWMHIMHFSWVRFVSVIIKWDLVTANWLSHSYLTSVSPQVSINTFVVLLFTIRWYLPLLLYWLLLR